MIFSCKTEKKANPVITKPEPVVDAATKKEYYQLKASSPATNAEFDVSIMKEFKKVLEENELIDFKKINEGDISEFEKLKGFDTNEEWFQVLYFGECWDSRPKTFRELDFVETDRKSLVKLNDTDIDILKLFNIIGFNFNSKNRLYSSEIKFTGKHICNSKTYNYYTSINILYKVKLKRGGIKISNLKELGANIEAGKAEVEYFFKSKGIQINPDSEDEPKYSITSSGLFNKDSKIELDNKIDYFLKEIVKEKGAFMARPFPEDFEFIKE